VLAGKALALDPIERSPTAKKQPEETEDDEVPDGENLTAEQLDIASVETLQNYTDIGTTRISAYSALLNSAGTGGRWLRSRWRGGIKALGPPRTEG
jgi:hypothetical protein